MLSCCNKFVHVFLYVSRAALAFVLCQCSRSVPLPDPFIPSGPSHATYCFAILRQERLCLVLHTVGSDSPPHMSDSPSPLLLLFRALHVFAYKECEPLGLLVDYKAGMIGIKIFGMECVCTLAGMIFKGLCCVSFVAFACSNLNIIYPLFYFGKMRADFRGLLFDFTHHQLLQP